MQQKTILQSISCSGVGVHSGASVTLTLRPAKENTGIKFVRSDLSSLSQKDKTIVAKWDNVTDTRLCTKLSNSYGTTVSTVEHLMAAFAGLGISNIIAEVSGPELPIMDGSAAPFLFLIECAGIKEQAAKAKYLKIVKDIEVKSEDGSRSARLMPCDSFKVSYEFDFSKRNNLANQQYICTNIQDCFKEELARARTFGFYEDVEMLRKNGLAQGGSLQNAIVFDGDTILNPEGLRFEDECVRHKALDAVGDLYLSGYMIQGHFHGNGAGHALNNKILHALFQDPKAWKIVEKHEEDMILPTSKRFSAIIGQGQQAIA
jgi:UDP-3-O-[3-hydroxymyristoyl] N-acetylglucosamine deacetylase